MPVFTVDLIRNDGAARDLLEKLSAAEKDAPFRGELGDLLEELDFAIVVGLTTTATSARNAVRDGLDDRFDLNRASFVERGVVMTPATKANPEATIVAQDDFLARHEEGGIVRPRSGRSLAVPTSFFTARHGAVIPARLEPRSALLRSTIFPMTVDAGRGGEIRMIAQRRFRKRKKETERARRRRLGISRLTAFERDEGIRARQPRDRLGRFDRVAALTKSGDVFKLARRRGPPPPRKDDRGISILYVLTEDAKLEGRGFFVPVIQDATTDQFFQELAKSVRTGLDRRRTGRQ